jgi:hypothetical protein
MDSERVREGVINSSETEKNKVYAGPPPLVCRGGPPPGCLYVCVSGCGVALYVPGR